MSPLASLGAADAETLRSTGEEVRALAEHLARSDPRRLASLAAELEAAARTTPSFAPWACWAQGTGEHLRGRPRAAAPLLRKAARLFRRSRDHHTAARVEIALIDAEACLGHHRSALRTGRRALETFRSLEDKPREVSTLMNLGGLADSRDHVAKAAGLWRQARALLTLDDLSRRAALDGNEANACLALGQFRRSLVLYTSAADLFDELGATATAGAARLGAAECRALVGEVGEALAHAHQAEKNALEMEDQGLLLEARLLTARLELELGHGERAARIATETLATAEDAGRTADLARLKVIIALAVVRGAPGSADKTIREAEQALEDAKLKVALAAFRSELARTGRGTDPTQLGRDASILARAGLHVQADLARLNQARRLSENGQIAKAQRLCRAVLDGRHVSVWPKIEAHEILARISAPDHPNDAVIHLRRLLRLAESIRGRLGCEADRTAFMARVLASYELLVELLLRRGDARSRRQAFETVARVKSRALLDALDRKGEGRWAAAPELLEQWRSMRGELATMLAELESRHDPHTRYSPVVVAGRVQRLSTRLNELELELARSDPAVGALLGRAPEQHLRPSLRPGEVFVELYLSGDDLVVFDLRPSGLAVDVLPGVRSYLLENVEGVRFQLSKASYGRRLLERPGDVLVAQARSHLEALGELLFNRVYRRGEPETLFVAPHGCLHHVPMAALEVGARPTVCTATVAVAPSSQVLARLLQRYHPIPERLGIAGAAPATLPEISAEVEAVAQNLAVSATANEATVNDVLDLLGACDGVHIASHGAFQPLIPVGSGIRLADGWLTALDLLQRTIKARFVSVGSCASGEVAVTPGEELMGFIRALLGAGTDTAILTLGALDDEIARITAQSLYSDLIPHGPGEALRRAQLSLRAEHPHPALWAAFQLYGNPRPWETP